MIDEWEAVARDLLLELGSPSAPVDMYELAHDCGFDVYAGGRGSRTQLVGDRIIQVDETLPVRLREAEVAFALGRWALHRAGVDFSDRGAEYIGLALLLAQDQLAIDPGKKQGYLPSYELHPLVSMGVSGRRIRRSVETMVDPRVAAPFAPRQVAKATT